jgi:hypothetical protein
VPVSNCSALAYYPSQRLVTHNIAPKLRQNRFKYRATKADLKGATATYRIGNTTVTKIPELTLSGFALTTLLP